MTNKKTKQACKNDNKKKVCLTNYNCLQNHEAATEGNPHMPH